MKLKINKITFLVLKSGKTITLEYDPIYFPIVKRFFDRNNPIQSVEFNDSKPRSTGKYSQRNHFNGHLQQISMETGNDFYKIKEWVKREAISAGWPIVMLPNGVTIPRSEADVTTEECSAGIDCCHRLAAELNIVLIEE